MCLFMHHTDVVLVRLGETEKINQYKANRTSTWVSSRSRSGFCNHIVFYVGLFARYTKYPRRFNLWWIIGKVVRNGKQRVFLDALEFPLFAFAQEPLSFFFSKFFNLLSFPRIDIFATQKTSPRGLFICVEEHIYIPHFSSTPPVKRFSRKDWKTQNWLPRYRNVNHPLWNACDGGVLPSGYIYNEIFFSLSVRSIQCQS